MKVELIELVTQIFGMIAAFLIGRARKKEQ